MNKDKGTLDRLSAWVEKQSSVGPAAYRQMREEIEREVEMELRGHLDSSVALQASAFEVAKTMLEANPILRERLRRWLAEEASGPADASSELSEPTESRELDAAAQATEKAKALASFCAENGIELESVLREIFP